MNSITNGNALSEFLQGMVSENVLETEAALEANQLPTVDLQEQAVEVFRDHKCVMRLVVQDLQITSTNQSVPIQYAPVKKPSSALAAS